VSPLHRRYAIALAIAVAVGIAAASILYRVALGYAPFLAEKRMQLWVVLGVVAIIFGTSAHKLVLGTLRKRDERNRLPSARQIANE
jgi:hypothetical protein